ncbi:TRAP transporter large permease [Cereibacter azotoformans]|uniref:TRAP transporter large permease protein n=2 Tax=Cereibacter TaxID=1653176 RepID=A0A2T5KD73_9RHOB|nr:TRAP transporter large permease [Cereibacter azotoformans]MBO4168661.1 TRAP transporter large permease [Cereibacter azotoformans]PTR20349.1 tripartite ATP-independent transporter DctM subunit [Cereibacter azotoformans]UIJ31909.1 TRAP transporter large permease [Cereibacter azotoformans]ULB09739.1 TRAP transporter large permease [Cereibacter azotoformans]
MDPITLVFGSLVVFLLFGVPVAYALGMSSLLVIVWADLPLSIFAQRAYQSLDSFVMLAVPFFLLVGLLMNSAGISARMLELAGAMFGRTRGALAKVNVAVSMLFAGLSGSSVADVAGMGSVLIPAMIREGYPRAFAVAVTAASSTIGIIIPPSIFMVVYGAVGDVSIGALFLAGALPGLLIGVTQITFCHLLAIRQNHPVGQPFSLARLGRAAQRGVLPFGVTVVIIGGIIGGIFTATEAAAVAVIYTLLLGIFYRTLKLRGLIDSFHGAAVHLGPTLLCVATGSVFAWVLAFLQVPNEVSRMVAYLDPSPSMVLMFIMVLFVIVGTFESGVASIIIFLPIVQPIAAAAGLDPVHVGVIVCMTLALGLITPPYGLCLFVAARIGGISVERSFVAVLPWIGLFLVVDVICVLLPDLVLFLPRLLVPQFMGMPQ